MLARIRFVCKHEGTGTFCMNICLGNLAGFFFYCADEMLQMVLTRHHAIRRSWDSSEVFKKLKSNDMIVFQNLA